MKPIRLLFIAIIFTSAAPSASAYCHGIGGGVPHLFVFENEPFARITLYRNQNSGDPAAVTPLRMHGPNAWGRIYALCILRAVRPQCCVGRRIHCIMHRYDPLSTPQDRGPVEAGRGESHSDRVTLWGDSGDL